MQRNLKQWCGLSSVVPLLLAIMLGPLIMVAQSEGNPAEQPELRPAYLEMAAAWQDVQFRDFATSPLFYGGRPLGVSLGHREEYARRTSLVRVGYAFGTLQQEFNAHRQSSSVHLLSFQHLELYRLAALSSSRLNVKVGGQLAADMNFRRNPDLFNNREGFEVVGNLLLSAGLEWNFNRAQPRQRRFLFWSYRAPARRRSFFLQLHSGLLNAAYRNGYAYMGQGAIRNTDDFFDTYELRLGSGYRFRSEWGYTHYLTNGNGLRLTYLWDAYSTGGAEPFQLARHALQLALWYKLK